MPVMIQSSTFQLLRDLEGSCWSEVFSVEILTQELSLDRTMDACLDCCHAALDILWRKENPSFSSSDDDEDEEEDKVMMLVFVSLMYLVERGSPVTSEVLIVALRALEVSTQRVSPSSTSQHLTLVHLTLEIVSRYDGLASSSSSSSSRIQHHPQAYSIYLGIFVHLRTFLTKVVSSRSLCRYLFTCGRVAQVLESMLRVNIPDVDHVTFLTFVKSIVDVLMITPIRLIEEDDYCQYLVLIHYRAHQTLKAILAFARESNVASPEAMQSLLTSIPEGPEHLTWLLRQPPQRVVPVTTLEYLSVRVCVSQRVSYFLYLFTRFFQHRRRTTVS